jgi:2-iminoacetate synthase
MTDFRIDDAAIQASLADAAALAARDARAALDRALDGHALDPLDVAALWFDHRIDTQTLHEAALAQRGPRSTHLETFAPLYLTNTCDAACLMCGMRRDNATLVRDTAGADRIEEQLRLLLARGMNAVALLTGEYRAPRRPWAMTYVNGALRTAERLGFGHVLLNVGSIDDDEFPALLDGLARRADGAIALKLTMCTFQETYSRRVYAKFMGQDAQNPRSDYERRLANFDRARRAGVRAANPGVLVGLSADVAFEMMAAILHVRHLLATGMEVYLSTPRVRRVAGGAARPASRGTGVNGGGAGDPGGIGDDDFVRLLALFSLALPEAKLVLTTREPHAIQQRLAPIVSVLSAGSSAVAPYTEDGARFPLEASQFEVIDQRPFEAILREHLDAGIAVENFAPPA